MSARLSASLLVTLYLAVGVAPDAAAEPARIIILRHGEKADPYRLCDVGMQRSLALTGRYLGRGAEAPIYGARGAPDAFFAITLHTLELIGPTAVSWRKPVIMNSALPLAKEDASAFTHLLNVRTQEAVADVMNNWNGKTVVMAWEHKHIADEKLALVVPAAEGDAAAVAQSRQSWATFQRLGPAATTITSGSSTTRTAGRRISRWSSRRSRRPTRTCRRTTGTRPPRCRRIAKAARRRCSLHASPHPERSERKADALSNGMATRSTALVAHRFEARLCVTLPQHEDQRWQTGQ